MLIGQDMLMASMLIARFNCITNLNCLFLVRVLKVQDKFRVDYLIGSEKSANLLDLLQHYFTYYTTQTLTIS
jgi:hypothetical protein